MAATTPIRNAVDRLAIWLNTRNHFARASNSNRTLVSVGVLANVGPCVLLRAEVERSVDPTVWCRRGAALDASEHGARFGIVRVAGQGSG